MLKKLENHKRNKKMAKKKKTLAEKIQKELDKLETLHEKEEAIMERIRDLVDNDDTDDLFDNDLERNSSLSG